MIRALITIMIPALSVDAFAATKKTKEKKPVAVTTANAKSKALKPNLKREIVFDGSTVGGRYHSAGEGVAKVEQEKKMNDIIGLRRDFKDRLQAEKDRLNRGETAVAE